MDNLNSSAALTEPPTVASYELELDPHTLFRRLRPLTPFIRSEDGCYLAIRAAEVERLATDPRTRQMEVEFIATRGVTAGPLFEFAKHSMLLSNGPAHRRRRAPLSRAFAVKLISELRPQIRLVADRLIDECLARGGMNFIAGYCAQIPARTIASMLGLPAADIPEFTRHVYSLARMLKTSFASDMVSEMQDSARHLTQYVDDIWKDRSKHPRDDLLTSYLEKLGEPAGPSRAEALSQVVTVILAGSDTTRTALAIQLSLLLQHPAQWQAVCGSSQLIAGAVMESLRYEPSVSSIPRFTIEDIEVDGRVVPSNSILRLSTMSAMRDPARYDRPDEFDITRSDWVRPHPVFGAGVHRCLGEALAKVELEEGLAALATRLPELELVGEPPRVHGGGGIRGIAECRLQRHASSWQLRA